MSNRNIYERLRDAVAEIIGREPTYLTALPAPTEGDYPLRKRQEDRLYRALSCRGSAIMLHGPGGMGKTHMARSLFYRLRRKYRRLAWVEYGNDLRTALTLMPQKGVIEKPDVRFARFMKELRKNPRDTILFIDDAKECAGEDPVLAQITGMGITVFLTSRCPEIASYESWELDPVTDSECVGLFYTNYQENLDRQYYKTVEKLVQSLDRNVFALLLLARVAGKKENLPHLAKALEKGTLMDHIGQLMGFSGLTDNQLEILHCLSLTPSSEILDNLVEWLNFPQDELEVLVEKGWLTRNPEMKSFILHDIVREYNKDRHPNRHTLERFLKSVLGENFCKSAETDLPADLRWKILEMQVYAIALMEKYWDTPRDLAEAYDNVGIGFREFGSYRRALEYIQMGLEVKKGIYPRDDLDLATSYHNIGSVYGDLGQFENAHEYLLKALAIRERILDEDNLDLANTYNNLGLAYGDLGFHNEELSYLLKALAIREKVLPEDEICLGTSYINVGTAYNAAEKYRMALDYLLKARVVLEKSRTESLELAILYNNLGVVCGKAGEDEDPMTYYLKALKIQEKALPQCHADRSVTYHNISKAYCDKKMYVEALEWARKALDVANQSLEVDHMYRKIYQEEVEYLIQKTKES